MYHHHFGLSQEPFGVTPDPEFFFSSAQHTEAAASLYYSVVQRRGFSALIAAPGLGKTSVIVSLLPRLRQCAEVVFLIHPKLDGDALLDSVLQGLGLDPANDRTRRSVQFAEYLVELDRRKRSCVVILDEAQNLSFEALESVRMLSNFEMPARKMVQFILVGQPALGAMLDRPEYEQIKQRINIVARLRPLSPEYIAAYIEARIRRAGGARNPFTSGAVKLIAEKTRGVPRIVNTLCFNALGLAYADTSSVVRERHVHEAWSDLQFQDVEDAPDMASDVGEAAVNPTGRTETRLVERVGAITARNWRTVIRALGLQQPQRSN